MQYSIAKEKKNFEHTHTHTHRVEVYSSWVKIWITFTLNVWNGKGAAM
jgi:hypothetical protein